MSTQIDLGPVLSVPKGDWNATTTYERLNIVRHNSASWICTVAASTGVEPTEDSTDWYLQVKDTSAVSSVNGMKGDVVIELTETETPPAEDSSTRIATTEWVAAKNTALETNLQTYVQEAIEEAEESISQNANNNINAVIDNYLPLTGGTLTGGLTGVRYTLNMPDMDVAATPASTVYGQPIIFTDKNNKAFASIQPLQSTSGSNCLNIKVNSKNTAQGSVLTLEQKVNGTSLLSLDGDYIVTGAGTGLTKSINELALATVVTAGNAGPTTNATPAFGATFTVPYITYDAYGRVTGRTNRTVKIPAAPTSVSTATKTTTVPNFAVAAANGKHCSGGSISGKNWVLPSGGTWRYIKLYAVGTSNGAAVCGTVAGGSSLPLSETEGGANGNDYSYNYIAVRIS